MLVYFKIEFIPVMQSWFSLAAITPVLKMQQAISEKKFDIRNQPKQTHPHFSAHKMHKHAIQEWMSLYHSWSEEK